MRSVVSSGQNLSFPNGSTLLLDDQDPIQIDQDHFDGNPRPRERIHSLSDDEDTKRAKNKAKGMGCFKANSKS